MSKVIDKLKQLQADAQVFYVKVHNYHWNVRGMDFHPTHKALQEIYEEFAEVFDDTAERILQLGGTPYLTMSDISKNAKIKEESKSSFDSKTVLKAVLSDYEYFEKTFAELSQLADESGDKVSGAYADDKCASLQKAIWMLKAQLS
ncbi:Dps family protein [Helicobacter sp. 23-1046]